MLKVLSDGLVECGRNPEVIHLFLKQEGSNQANSSKKVILRVIVGTMLHLHTSGPLKVVSDFT